MNPFTGVTNDSKCASESKFVAAGRLIGAMHYRGALAAATTGSSDGGSNEDTGFSLLLSCVRVLLGQASETVAELRRNASTAQSVSASPAIYAAELALNYALRASGAAKKDAFRDEDSAALLTVGLPPANRARAANLAAAVHAIFGFAKEGDGDGVGPAGDGEQQRVVIRTDARDPESAQWVELVAATSSSWATFADASIASRDYATASTILLQQEHRNALLWFRALALLLPSIVFKQKSKAHASPAARLADTLSEQLIATIIPEYNLAAKGSLLSIARIIRGHFCLRNNDSAQAHNFFAETLHAERHARLRTLALEGCVLCAAFDPSLADADCFELLETSGSSTSKSITLFYRAMVDFASRQNVVLRARSLCTAAQHLVTALLCDSGTSERAGLVSVDQFSVFLRRMIVSPFDADSLSAVPKTISRTLVMALVSALFDFCPYSDFSSFEIDQEKNDDILSFSSCSSDFNPSAAIEKLLNSATTLNLGEPENPDEWCLLTQAMFYATACNDKPKGMKFFEKVGKTDNTDYTVSLIQAEIFLCSSAIETVKQAQKCLENALAVNLDLQSNPDFIILCHICKRKTMASNEQRACPTSAIFSTPSLSTISDFALKVMPLRTLFLYYREKMYTSTTAGEVSKVLEEAKTSRLRDAPVLLAELVMLELVVILDLRYESPEAVLSKCSSLKLSSKILLEVLGSDPGVTKISTFSYICDTMISRLSSHIVNACALSTTTTRRSSTATNATGVKGARRQSLLSVSVSSQEKLDSKDLLQTEKGQGPSSLQNRNQNWTAVFASRKERVVMCKALVQKTPPEAAFTAYFAYLDALADCEEWEQIRIALSEMQSTVKPDAASTVRISRFLCARNRFQECIQYLQDSLIQASGASSQTTASKFQQVVRIELSRVLRVTGKPQEAFEVLQALIKNSHSEISQDLANAIACAQSALPNSNLREALRAVDAGLGCELSSPAHVFQMFLMRYDITKTNEDLASAVKSWRGLVATTQQKECWRATSSICRRLLSRQNVPIELLQEVEDTVSGNTLQFSNTLVEVSLLCARSQLGKNDYKKALEALKELSKGGLFESNQIDSTKKENAEAVAMLSELAYRIHGVCPLAESLIPEDILACARRLQRPKTTSNGSANSRSLCCCTSDSDFSETYLSKLYAAGMLLKMQGETAKSTAAFDCCRRKAISFGLSELAVLATLRILEFLMLPMLSSIAKNLPFSPNVVTTARMIVDELDALEKDSVRGLMWRCLVRMAVGDEDGPHVVLNMSDGLGDQTPECLLVRGIANLTISSRSSKPGSSGVSQRELKACTFLRRLSTLTTTTLDQRNVVETGILVLADHLLTVREDNASANSLAAFVLENNKASARAYELRAAANCADLDAKEDAAALWRQAWRAHGRAPTRNSVASSFAKALLKSGRPELAIRVCVQSSKDQADQDDMDDELRAVFETGASQLRM